VSKEFQSWIRVGLDQVEWIVDIYLFDELVQILGEIPVL